jgi:novel plant SNARE
MQQKADLVDGASPSMKDPGLLEDQEMLDEATRIQGKDKQATRRMLKMVNQTEDIAASTMDTMKNQTEQISKIHADLEEMDSTLKLADQQIKQYVRKMATDKLIMAMMFLIVMGLVAIMVLKTLGFFSDDEVNVPHEVTDSAKDMMGRRALRSTILSAVPVSGRGATLVDYIL